MVLQAKLRVHALSQSSPVVWGHTFDVFPLFSVQLPGILLDMVGNKRPEVSRVLCLLLRRLCLPVFWEEQL